MSQTACEETYEHVSILEYNETAGEFDREPGARVIVSGVQRNQHVRCDERKGFPKIADAVAIIELDRPLTDDEVTEWCNTEVGKLVLAHWFDNVDPNQVISS
ncbi:hypothetical protein ACFQO4_20805 [Saliphagus sp. GCM10025334]